MLHIVGCFMPQLQVQSTGALCKGAWNLLARLVAARSRSLASEINVCLFNETEHVTST
jgi:hypothetical protein